MLTPFDASLGAGRCRGHCVQGRAPAPPRPSGMTPNRPRFDPGPSADRSAGVRAICLRPLLTATTTRHPADIPQEDAGSSRPPPPIPASPRLERPALPGDPRLSPLSPEPPRPACHAGGRGFESRRSRFDEASARPRARPSSRATTGIAISKPDVRRLTRKRCRLGSRHMPRAAETATWTAQRERRMG